MRSIVLFVVLMSTAAAVTAQTFKIWDDKGNDAWIDIKGNIVDRPRSEDIGVFSEGLATIRVGDKTGYINEKGEIVIQPRWSHDRRHGMAVAGVFSEGLAAVIEEVMKSYEDEEEYYIFKCGYIDKTGKYVIEPKYRGGCGTFSNGRARVALDRNDPEYKAGQGAMGFMDKSGNWAIKPQFFEATEFKDGYALVRDEPWPNDWNEVERKSLHLIDTDGKSALALKDCGWRYSFYEGLALIRKKGQRPTYINEKCEVAFVLLPGIELENATTFSEGRLPVYKMQDGNRVFGYLDKTGKIAVGFRYASAFPFSDGLANVGFEDKSGSSRSYIDKTGMVVLANVRGAGSFTNGLAMHFLHLYTINSVGDHRNIYGYMNKQGKYIWLAPKAEFYLDKNWIRDNYVGPDTRFRQL